MHGQKNIKKYIRYIHAAICLVETVRGSILKNIFLNCFCALMVTFIKMEDTYLFRHLYVQMIYSVTKQRQRSVPFRLTASRLRLKCDGTRAETRSCLSAKRTSPFKSAGTSVQSTIGSRGVGISGSNVGYNKFRGSEGYWLPTPLASFPFTSPPVRHRVPSHFNWTLQPCHCRQFT
jgi:hypothetical protein